MKSPACRVIWWQGKLDFSVNEIIYGSDILEMEISREPDTGIR